MRHQVIIIGSGLGGLLTGLFLAKEGYDVGIVEQNKQIGGCLQTFSFNKKIFDSAVHYIGALDEGQAQQKIFAYAGIMADLRLKKLDENCFDEIWINNAENTCLAQGFEQFEQSLISQFPTEITAVTTYIRQLRNTTDRFPLYNLRVGDANEKNSVNYQSLQEILVDSGASQSLQNTICGNAILYAGDKNTTAFYQHALIQSSYINGAYKCVGGSSQMSKLLWKQLTENGATIYRHEKIEELLVDNGNVTTARSQSGLVFNADYFISNIHPKKTIELLSDTAALKNIYRKRIIEAPNTVGCLMLNLVLKKRQLPYTNHNINWHSGNSLDSVAQCHHFPSNYSLYYSEDPLQCGFSETISVLSYVPTSWFHQWKDSYNNTIAPSNRSESYQTYKTELADRLLQTIYQRLPELKDAIASMHIATPLSFRDYQGSAEGSLYGMLKDVRHLAQSSLTPQTKIPNLLLTGQNLNLHGVLGVSMSSVTTAAQFLGMEYLINKIKNS